MKPFLIIAGILVALLVVLVGTCTLLSFIERTNKAPFVPLEAAVKKYNDLPGTKDEDRIQISLENGFAMLIPASLMKTEQKKQWIDRAEAVLKDIYDKEGKTMPKIKALKAVHFDASNGRAIRFVTPQVIFENGEATSVSLQFDETEESTIRWVQNWTAFLERKVRAEAPPPPPPPAEPKKFKGLPDPD